MRLVFVDDERRVLDGLEMMLFDQLDDWDVAFFESGSDALEYLASNDADVIVTDMRMPGMSGEQLLRLVAQRHPEVVRIVLSGQVDADVAERILVMVHDFLPKPCEASELVATVCRGLALARSGRPDHLRRMVGAATRLPSRPNTYFKIRETMARDDFSLDDLADILETDIAMSTTVLHLANSAYFARGAHAGNVRDATRRLGAEVIAGVALTAESLGAFEVPGVEVDKLNEHGIRSVAALRQLLDHPTSWELEAVALHPVGHLVIASMLPDQYAQALSLAEQRACSLPLALDHLLGFTDAHAGAYLLRLWNLDERVATNIEMMDEPWNLPEDSRRASALLWSLHRASGRRSDTVGAPEQLPADIAAIEAAAKQYREEAA